MQCNLRKYEGSKNYFKIDHAGVGGADLLQQHNMAAVKEVSRRILDEATELLTPEQQDWLLLQLARNTPVGCEA